MKNKTVWIVAIVVILIILLAFPAGMLLGREMPFSRFAADSGHGMMDWGLGFFQFFNIGAVLVMVLIPIGLLILVILGIVALVNVLKQPQSPPATQVMPAPPVVPLPEQPTLRTCASCGRVAQADWSTCPYCGSPLS